MISIRRAVVLAVIVAAALAVASPAAAHAVIERSDPPASTSLTAAPRQITLWITEAVDPTFSSVVVLDRSGRRVSGRLTISADRRRMTVPLEALPTGIYTVKWRVLSGVDGHTTAGIFLFAVGLSLQLGPAAGSSVAPDPLLVGIRWLGFLAAFVLAGSVFFQLAVLRPGLASAELRTDRQIAAATARQLRALAVIAGPILLVSLAGQVALQTAALLDTPPSDILASGMLWSFVGGTKLGWSTLIQTAMTLLLLLPSSDRGRVVQAAGLVFSIGVGGLAVLFGGLVALTSSIHLLHLVLVVIASLAYGLLTVIRRPSEAIWVPAAAAAGLLGAFTVASHAAGSGPLAVAADWIHLLAAALWTGGLASLLLVLRTAEPAHRTVLAQTLVPRFSQTAAIGLGVLVITGTYSAWLHIPALRAFTVTLYGQELLIKLALILPLAALGALNRFVLRPRLEVEGRRPNVSAHRRLLQSVGGEVALAGAVLLVVASLTITAPARVSLPASGTAQAPLQLAGLAGDARIALTITPAVPGWNRFEVQTARRDTAPIDSEARILLRLTKLDEDLSPVTLQARPEQAGRYVVEGGELAVPGWWQIEVIVRRRGQVDVSTSFPLRLGQPQSPPSNPAAERLLAQARAASSPRSWVEVQQLADGAGGMVLTSFEFIMPGRMHYQAADGTEVIVIGTTRYLRTGPGPWERDTVSQPPRAEGPLLYMRDARAVVPGRQMPCDDESCQVVLWEWDQTTTFAARIGLRSHRVHELLMVAPSHYMTVQYRDFNAPIRIVAPH